MGVESASFISQLDELAPLGSETIAEGDDHLRLIKLVVKNSFPSVSGAVTATHTELNHMDGVTSNVQSQLNALSALINASVFAPTYGTTVTAAGTTTITASSAQQQYFTGTTTQTLQLPVASTMTLGQWFLIVNSSTGAVTVQSSGGNTVIVVAAGAWAVVTCILTSGTDAASWNSRYSGAIVASGKKLTVSNSLTFTGTDGSTVAFGTGGTVLYTGSSITSADLASMLSDELGTAGKVLFGQVGTFTAVAEGDGTTGTGTYSSQAGEYTYVGDRVLFTIKAAWSAHTGTGGLFISGLPASASADSCASVHYDTLTAASGKQLTARVIGGLSRVYLYSSDPAGGSVAQVAVDGSVANLTISGQYRRF
jgi:hypothetical protein